MEEWVSPFLTTSRGDDGILPNPDESADPVADLSITLRQGILLFSSLPLNHTLYSPCPLSLPHHGLSFLLYHE